MILFMCLFGATSHNYQKNKPVTESSSTDALRAMEIVEKAYGNSQFYRHNEGQHGILNRSIKSFPTRHQTDGMP